MIEISNEKTIKEYCTKYQISSHFSDWDSLTKRLVRYQKGEIVAMYEGKVKKIFFLVQGTIRFSCFADNFEEYFFFDAANEGLFGEVEYLLDIPLITQSEVIEESICIELPLKENKKLLDNDLKFQRFVGEVLARKYNEIRKYNVNDHTYSLRFRLAKYLCNIVEQNLPLPSLTLIAKQLRCSYRQLLREFKYLCDQGWLEHLPQKGKYRIVDYQALHQFTDTYDSDAE